MEKYKKTKNEVKLLVTTIKTTIFELVYQELSARPEGMKLYS